MRIALYDGTIDGLLSVIGDCLERGSSPDEIAVAGEFQGDLFAEVVRFDSGPASADTVLTKLRERLGPDMTGDLLFAFLSDDPKIEKLVADYALAGWRRGPSARGDMSDAVVLAIRKTVRRVKFEAHRFTGLVRFRELSDGTLYAPVNPDNDVVMLVARHFRERLSSQRWVIHDTRRGKAAIYDGRRLEESFIDEAPDLQSRAAPVSQDEAYYRELWKTFYKNIAIAERKNWRCRAQHMPKKYWQYLVEMEG